MITLVEGNIGSGKTYFVVNEVLKKYFRFSETELKWIPREDIEITLYSNVEGFHVAKDLNSVIKEAGGLEKFFNAEYQKKFTRLNKHVYVIDEVQQPGFFHRKFYNPDVFFFFQYHRHYGVDIYMITQDVNSVARDLQALPEYHIRAVRRSYAFAKEFRYNYMVGNDIFRRRTFKRDLRVFSAFKSSCVNSSHEIVPFARKYYLYIGIFICLVIGGFYTMLKYRFNPPASVDKVVEVKKEGNYKIVALNNDNALVKSLSTKKIKKVPYSEINGDLRIGSIIDIRL